MPAEPFVVGPGEGLSVENPVGGTTTFKTTAATTAGAFTAVEGVAAPAEGPPLHVHHDQDELIYTLEGRFRIRLGDDVVEARPGSVTFIPRGTAHTWQNAGDAPGRFLALLAPASAPFEDFFARYAELAEHERGGDAFARLAAETQGMEVVGPPLGPDPR